MIPAPLVTGEVNRLINSTKSSHVQEDRSRPSIIVVSDEVFLVRLPLSTNVLSLDDHLSHGDEPFSRLHPNSTRGMVLDPCAMRLERRFRRAGIEANFVGMTELWDIPEKDIVLKTLVADWCIREFKSETLIPLLDGLVSNRVTIRFSYHSIRRLCPTSVPVDDFLKKAVVDLRLDWCARESVPVQYVKNYEGNVDDVNCKFLSVTFVFESHTDATDFELHWGCGLQHVILVDPQHRM
ncbi:MULTISPECIES: hypothetical protein [unclassified Azospirillum]|uniref:hypothetical protein n=1 Tax=unclassified Azospirillum TaxID=2630922 RepID=UPI0011B26DFD|nr:MULTISPECIES: hypothetical protein [unclassified Azospirillum]